MHVAKALQLSINDVLVFDYPSGSQFSPKSVIGTGLSHTISQYNG